MSQHPDPDWLTHLNSTTPDHRPEHNRIQHARARADHHAVRELYFLDLAVNAPDDESASTLEAYAFEAYQDNLAITTEHDIER